MATYETVDAALRRARKRYAHAVAQAADAQTERSAARHARRIRNARKAMDAARHGFSFYALAEAADL